MPLLRSYHESHALLYVLTEVLKKIGSEAEKSLGAELAVVAFGSFGRRDAKLDTSDLDAMILIRHPSSIDKNKVRNAVLTPLSSCCPWLILDDAEAVRSSRWDRVTNVDLKYAVYVVDDLLHSKDEISVARRWQILFESQCLYGHGMYTEVCMSVLPQVPEKFRKYIKASPLGTVNFDRLLTEVPDYFAQFENPILLYKSASKYWKTQFLRQFFTFSNVVNCVVGSKWTSSPAVIDAANPLDYLQSTTADKLIRVLRAVQDTANQFDKSDEHVFEEIVVAHHLEEVRPIGDGNLVVASFRSLVVRLLAKFAQCWVRLYDPLTLQLLQRVPTSKIAPHAVFTPTIDDPEARVLMQTLAEMQSSYLRYMAAVAQLLDQLVIPARSRTTSIGPASAILRRYYVS